MKEPNEKELKKMFKSLKKEIRNDILSTKDSIYKVAEYTDHEDKPYFVIFNDKWPHLDKEYAEVDPETRLIVRSYGPTFARLLVVYRDIINSVFKVANTTFTVHKNKDVIIYNNHYRVRFTRNIEAIPVQFNKVN